MRLISFRTKRFMPPQDALEPELERLAPSLRSGDVVLVSSKVVAIDEGRCERLSEAEKRERVRLEADLVIERPYWPTPLTVTRNSFIGAAGLDESNGNGYVVSLPEDAFASAARIHERLSNLTKHAELGVIITDSRSQPFRFGAVGVALGWWGIAPLESHIGEEDLFGRPLQYERSNIVDGLAAAACVVMGEVDEQTPIVIARDVPALRFVERNTKDELFSSFEEDTFRVLYERFLPGSDSDTLAV